MIDFRELPPDGIRFEQLARELLLREDFDVQWTGVGPDGGRDLVVTERAPGPIASFSRRWVVSCKHFAHGGAAVGVNDLDRSLVDSCRALDATGFLLICSTHPSAALIRRFDEIERTADITCVYWDAVALERRLTTLRAFSLVHAFFPASSKTLDWAVYNAGSPTFWCASHGGHFFYLSSRVVSGEPRLIDATEILKRLTAIALPTGDEFGQRERLRLRAVAFDDKHEQFRVYVDYIVPHKIVPGAAISQTYTGPQLLAALDDGAGLYSDGDWCWYTTYWDLMRVPAFQLSDAFDEDGRRYYEPHMAAFESGSPRDGALSAHSWGRTSWDDPPTPVLTRSGTRGRTNKRR